jgi:MSHA biogenesis protein MshK
MKPRERTRSPGLALGVALLLAATIAQAQGSGLSDPTRPPGAGAGWQQGASNEPPAGRQLQSVLLSGGRRLAIIDGTMVALGGMLGDSKVVKISETEVVLKNGEETETLKLYPGVDKIPAKRAPARARAGVAAPASSPQGGSK